ncbi:hypothetical protein E2C01_062775 [Portunus trituberculatus]|uniref:Uncharacterized protein n=1 Tax=Portunus trituberculatus TaxID=210409 RepID=A0A5B7HEM8_PORTR|nr:hypothetical protein [Portunus trituberculatus]
MRYKIEWHKAIRNKSTRKASDFRNSNFDRLRGYLQGVVWQGTGRESQVRSRMQRSRMQLREGRQGQRGGMRCDAGEGESQRVEVGGSRSSQAEKLVGVGQVNVGEEYSYLQAKLHRGQVLYKTIKQKQ